MPRTLCGGINLNSDIIKNKSILNYNFLLNLNQILVGYSCMIISVITKKFNFQIMIKMTQFYDDFYAQNVPEIWETGSKLRYVDRLTP